MTITKEEVLRILGTQPGLPQLPQTDKVRVHAEVLDTLAQLQIDWDKSNCTCIHVNLVTCAPSTT